MAREVLIIQNGWNGDDPLHLPPSTGDPEFWDTVDWLVRNKFQIAKYIGGNATDAKDIWQEFLVLLHRNYEKVRGSDDPIAYCHIMVTNVAHSYNRKKNRIASHESQLEDCSDIAPSGGNFKKMLGDHGLVVFGRILKFCGSLSLEDRMIIDAIMQDWHSENLARDLSTLGKQVSEATARKKVERFKKKIKKLCKRHKLNYNDLWL